MTKLHRHLEEGRVDRLDIKNILLHLMISRQLLSFSIKIWAEYAVSAMMLNL
jgi:hypothetical protein